MTELTPKVKNRMTLPVLKQLICDLHWQWLVLAVVLLPWYHLSSHWILCKTVLSGYFSETKHNS